MIDRKYFRYKIKKAAVTCATIFVALTAIKNFPTAEENPAPKIEIKPVAVEKTEKPPLEKVKPRENPKKFEWAEIKIPETVNLSINPTVKIFEINTIEDSEKVTDPRLNQVCTLNLNGALYHNGDGDISSETWKAWKIEGENIYLPENFSVSFKLENKNTAPLNVSVTANLNGLQKSEKVFTETIAAAQSKNFEIPIGGLACNNGSFEVEIWLRENNGTPLFGIWNGENFNNKGTIRIYLQNYRR